MDDFLDVSRPERARRLDRVSERRGDIQRRVAADQLLEGFTLDVLEHDVWGTTLDAVRVLFLVGVPLAGVDHGHYVWIVELRHRPRLAAKALELTGVRGDLAVHQLDRDLAFEHGVK